MEPTQAAPDIVFASDDPGDDTARRYRYQWAYAAITCCMLLDDAENVSEVFCEHHEDVLIKRDNGSFLGFQVKTRESDQPVWRTGDDAVKKACARFAKLESDFPGRFVGYRFLTNHLLYSSDNGRNLNFILKKTREVASVDDLPRDCIRFINEIARRAHYCPK